MILAALRAVSKSGWRKIEDVRRVQHGTDSTMKAYRYDLWATRIYSDILDESTIVYGFAAIKLRNQDVVGLLVVVACHVCTNVWITAWFPGRCTWKFAVLWASLCNCLFSNQIKERQKKREMRTTIPWWTMWIYQNMTACAPAVARVYIIKSDSILSSIVIESSPEWTQLWLQRCCWCCCASG